jgi:hypothetical protein
VDNDSANPDTSSSASSSFYLRLFFFQIGRGTRGIGGYGGSCEVGKGNTRSSLYLFFFREESSTKGFFPIVGKGGRIGRLSTRPSTTPLLAGTPNTLCLSTHETLLNTARGKREREREPNVWPSLFFNTFFILLFYIFRKGGHAGKRAGCLSLERFLEFCSSNWPTPLLFRSFPLKLYTTSFTLWPRIHIDIYIYSIYIYTRTEQPSQDCWLDCIVQTLGYLSSVRLIDCHRCHRPISSVLFWAKLSPSSLYISCPVSLFSLSLSLISLRLMKTHPADGWWIAQSPIIPKVQQRHHGFV